MNHTFYKRLFYLTVIFMLISLACMSSSRVDPTATDVAQIEREEPEATEPSEILVAEPEPTQPPPVVEPTTPPTMEPVVDPTEETQDYPIGDPYGETPPAFFVEEFQGDLDSWTYFLMSGDENKMDLYTENDRLVFDLQGQYQWVYVLYDEYTYSGVRLDLLAENRAKNTNNVSLICNYSDRFGWYEFNVSNGGLYYIYVYSEIDGDYFTLASGGSTNVRMGRDINLYTAVCQGNRLALYINGVLEREHVDNRYNLNEGQVGFSVSSFDVLPILVEVDYFSIMEP